MASESSKKEKFFFYNNLAILLKAVEGEQTTVDLRNEATVTGKLEQVDGFMNIVMSHCVFTDPRGGTFNYDQFFVHARNVRFVHIPQKIRIIPAIKDQLEQLSGQPREVATMKRTYKNKRAQEMQQQSLAAMEKILEDRRKIKTETIKTETT